MDVFPGGFPGMYPAEEQRPATDAVVAEQSTSHLQKSLNSRRRSFRKDVVHKLDTLTYVLMLILYLYDCSLFILLLRIGAQSVTLIMQYSPNLRLLLPKNSGKRSTFQLILVVNAISALIHYASDIPIPENDGFIFGHNTLQAIGQKQFTQKRWIFAYDIVLIYLQLLVFTTQYSLKKDEQLGYSSTIDQEYDGLQGRTVALRLPFLSVLKLKFVGLETLKAEDERDREESGRLESQIDSLVDHGTQRYGSVGDDLI